MSEYETEVERAALGWTYRLFLDGERVTAFPLGMKIYGSREAAIAAATGDAREHAETRKPKRVKIDL